MHHSSVTISSPYKGRLNKAKAGDSSTKGTGPRTVPSPHYMPSEPPGGGQTAHPSCQARAQEWCGAPQSVSQTE